MDASFFDPDTKLVLHSLGEGNIAVFHQDSPDKYTFVENIPTNKGSKTMGFDPKTHHLFVPSNQEGAFTILVLGQLRNPGPRGHPGARKPLGPVGTN